MFNLFTKSPSAPLPLPIPHYVIVEGVSGYWHYHLGKSDRYGKALCGADTMYTAMPLDNWKKKFGEHFPKRPSWCDTCEKIYAR